MENYRKKLKNRIIGGGIYCAFALLLTIFLPFATGRTYAGGFTVGFAGGIAIIALIYMIQAVRALHNEEKVRKLYIAETDERTQYIAGRCSLSSLLIILASVALATLVAVYFNKTVFYTLLSVTFGISFITAGSKIYYSKKL